MTALLGLLGSGLGPAGIAALLVGAVVAARAYLGKVGALAVGAGGLLLVAYLAGAPVRRPSRQTSPPRGPRCRHPPGAALAEERPRSSPRPPSRPPTPAGHGGRGRGPSDAGRLRDLESALKADSGSPCSTADDARPPEEL